MDTGETTAGKTRYHHGDLRNALLVAAEEELAEKGIEGFSLRGVAKRAGVSHAAPAHHFHDTGDMLTALATIAAERLTASMRAAMAAADRSPRAQFIASGVGYVHFALDNPALFQLLFGSKRPDSADKTLQIHASEAFMTLVNCVRAISGSDPMADDDGRLQIAAAWSMVHGLANLLIANRLAFAQPMLAADFDATLARLIGRVAPEPVQPG